MLSEEIQGVNINPVSKLGSMIMISETLYIINYATQQYKIRKPLSDELGLEYGTARLLSLVLSKNYFHNQTFNYRIKRLLKLNMIIASGVDYNEKMRKYPKANGKGRTTSARGNLVYILTNKGKRFLKDNKYLLERFKKIEVLESSLTALTIKKETKN